VLITNRKKQYQKAVKNGFKTIAKFEHTNQTRRSFSLRRAGETLFGDLAAIACAEDGNGYIFRAVNL
jgi:hypothetical protein